MKRRYKAALFATDGDWVTDHRGCETIDEVWERIANQGSRWFFYPFSVVIVDHYGFTTGTQRIVAGDELYEWAKGRTLNSFGKWLKANPKWVGVVLA